MCLVGDVWIIIVVVVVCCMSVIREREGGVDGREGVVVIELSCLFLSILGN